MSAGGQRFHVLHVDDDDLDVMNLQRAIRGHELVARFLAQLRDDPTLQHLPVVVLTTSTDSGDVAAAYRHHVAGYLQKPSDSDRFRDEIAAFVAYWAHVELP